MKKFIVTDLRLATRLYKCGLLKYFNNTELVFHITGPCFNNRLYAYSNDKEIAKKMVQEGLMVVSNLDSNQMQKVQELFEKYKPKFLAKTITSLVYAEQINYQLITEDECLKETAHELNIRAYNKEWLVTSLVSDITLMGGAIDLNMIMEII